MIKTSTLRPGLLVSLKTSIRGNVQYSRRDITPDHLTEDGKRQAAWETERVISDPVEHEWATKVRSKARTLITSVCASSAFGLLCPETDAEKLDAAIAAAREVIDDFNSMAKLTRISVYVIAGRIAPDDLEAVRAINSEVRDLLNDMERGVRNLDPKTIREAAGKARSVGSMLSPEAAARVSVAIEAARKAARKIVQAGEQAATEIDLGAVRRITEARTAFLDMDDAREVAAPAVDGRAIDLAPTAPVAAVTAPAPSFEM